MNDEGGAEAAVRPTGVVVLVRDIDAVRASWELLLDARMLAPVELPSGAKVGTFKGEGSMTVELLMPSKGAPSSDPLQEHLLEHGEGVLALILEAPDSETVYRLVTQAGVVDQVVEISLPTVTEYLVPGHALPGTGPEKSFSAAIAYRTQSTGSALGG